MPKLKRILLFFLLLVTFIQVNFAGAIDEIGVYPVFKAVEVKDGDILTLKDCVSTAFKNSPHIKRKKYEFDLAMANVGIAKSQYFPVIGAGIGFYNENNSNAVGYYSHNRNFPSVAASINQLIWNFGKTTAYIKMEEFYKLGAQYEFSDSLCSTLFDVKKKYYNVLHAKASVEIAQFNREMNEHFLALAQDRSKYEITTAQVNLSDADYQLIEAHNNYRNALIDLSNAMYLENQPDYSIVPTKTFSFESTIFKSPRIISDDLFQPQPFRFELSRIVDIAYTHSPELKVLISVKDAMEQSLKYVKKTYMPDMTAGLSYGFNKTNHEGNNNSLQVGVNLTSNVNLMELKNSVKAAQAQINLAENEILLFKKDLFFEVKRALNNVDKTQRQIPVAQTYLDEGLDNFHLIEEQYIAKNIDYTSLQDARKDYIQLLYNYIDSVYNYNIALIQLEEVTHYHVADIHGMANHAIEYHSQEILDELDKVLGCDDLKDINSSKL